MVKYPGFEPTVLTPTRFCLGEIPQVQGFASILIHGLMNVFCLLLLLFFIFLNVAIFCH